jgi:biotin carboxyl carrier protein
LEDLRKAIDAALIGVGRHPGGISEQMNAGAAVALSAKADTAEKPADRMELLTSVNGAERRVKLEPQASGSGYEFEVGTSRDLADVREVEPGVYSILIGARSYEVKIEEAEGRYIVAVNGDRFEVVVQDPRRPRRQAGVSDAEGPQEVASPMPGRVVKVEVRAGETVAAGQGLVVVEAMKMQNEIKSPKAGSVTAVYVEEGGSVSAGEPMVVIE